MMKILHIEPDATEVQRFCECLQVEKDKFEIKHTNSLDSARKILPAEKFNIIFLNPRLPDSWGLDALRYIKSETPETPIILISDMDDNNLIGNALTLGADDFLFNEEIDCKLIMKSIRYAIERKNANIRFHTTEARLKKLVNTTPSVVYVTKISPRYLCTYISDNFTSVMGYPKHEMIGSSTFWFNCVHPDDRTDAIATINEIIKNKSYGSVEYRFLAKDGAYHWIHDNLNVSCNDDGDPVEVLGSWSDITAYKDATEEAIRLSAAINSINESLIITDTAGNIIYVNPAFSRISGYSYKDVINQNYSILVQGNQNEKLFNQIARAIKYGDIFKATFINQTSTGDEYYLEQTITPVKNEKGKIIEHVWIGRDVTEQKNLDKRLRQSQKMEAIGQLTGGIAHDFNNRLTVILGNLQLLKRKPGIDQASLKLVDSAINATKGGATMTQRLLSFSRQQVLESEITNINEIITGISELIKNTINETIEISLKLARDSWNVAVDISQLEEVVLNICVNAQDAMPFGGKLNISTRNVDIKNQDIKNFPYRINAGNYVMLSISDTGCGMPEEVLEQIYEPFFTTKGPGKGTGLGMAMVYGFVKQSDGFINITSEQGKGTCIKIYLPATVTELTTKTTGADKSLPLPGIHFKYKNKKVLVVEDDIFVRKISKMLLEDIGLEVIEADNGNSAIELLNNNKGVNVVFSDMLMPGGMNGQEMIEKMRKNRPDLKAIIASGYSNEHVETREKNIIWVKKPFTRETLIEKFEQLFVEEKNHVYGQITSH